ncbi:low molecular weight protein arginine phosphatase [Sporosarcina limicola]|uniref:Protein-tyrosine phosphatase n=1 Tax=Sporosarcina limicola TaxID=34101 RepID=A0A927MJF1_9BACL|nr:low molecular weight protein arginine phosphatase [Sporosarcina limicola]MBE1555713.1 protein-tyrosine phosphatase [Sporosarcina limicola]
MNIYFVCTGNTCRSPIAEAILRSKMLDNVTVRSAGIHAQNGRPISSNAQTLIQEVDMPHTPISRAVSSEDLEWADLILTMTGAHRSILLDMYPKVGMKTFTLKEFVRPDSKGDVLDPFGGNLKTYRRTFDELQELIEVLEQKLVEGKE